MPLEFETVVKEGKIQLPFNVNLEGRKVKVVLYPDEEDIIEHLMEHPVELKPGEAGKPFSREELYAERTQRIGS